MNARLKPSALEDLLLTDLQCIIYNVAVVRAERLVPDTERTLSDDEEYAELQELMRQGTEYGSVTDGFTSAEQSVLLHSDTASLVQSLAQVSLSFL